MTIGGLEMVEIRPNFWVHKGTEVRDVGSYVEYWCDGKLMMADPKQRRVIDEPVRIRSDGREWP